MVKKITVCPEGGEPFEAELVMEFEIVESGNKYVVYTRNEMSGDGLVKLYVAGIQNQDGKCVAKSIESDEEWTKIKEIMKEVITGGK
ncbi:MAG TPA: DUF1292 domain-containing protein [Bacilli bacterium]|nr:DUF1292 domain-containing protein [Bacilli bacterium]